jgi:hypothetical protein
MYLLYVLEKEKGFGSGGGKFCIFVRFNNDTVERDEGSFEKETTE